MTDEQLRQTYARVLAERAGRGDCVAPEDLMAIVEATLPEHERLRVLRHVGSCGTCRSELELLRTAADAGRAIGRPRVPALAAAASLVLLLSGALVWRAMSFSGGDIPRSPADVMQPLSPAEGQVVTAPPRLVWTRVPGVQSYDIEVLDAGGTLVYRGETRDTTFTLPVDAVTASGAEYFWWVGADLPSGPHVRSAARRFRIQAP